MKYELTLIPMQEGQPVTFKGVDYTVAAQRHNVRLNGNQYYVRENHEGNVKYLTSLLEEPHTQTMSVLEHIEFSLPEDSTAPIKITIEREEE